MIFCSLMLLPLLVELGFFLFAQKKLRLQSLLIEMGVQAAITALMLLCLYYSDTSDTEILNGKVTQKYSEHVSCEHSYRCHCHMVTHCSGSGKKRSCETDEECDTCYEHPWDVDWNVKSSLGTEISIDRVDRRGLEEPPRWAAIQVGEPYSRTHSYTNYIKASSDTLFRHQGLTEKYKDWLPKYPGGIYDYYRLNRLVAVDTAVPEANLWNADLSQINADLGAARQVNAVVVVLRGQSREYYSALEQHWIGGKKNDATLVLDVGPDGKVDWSEVMAWTQDMLFKVKGREDFVGLPLDRTIILPKFRELIATHFVRKPMADFAYLRASVTPSMTEWVVAMVIGLAVSIGMCIFFKENEDSL
jgi:hypothetical protein